MAKGNMLLGKARGIVGSVVFSQRDGQQVARAKADTVKNPSTQKQLIQRAVAATISRAYAAGRQIFDHSFEGRTVPNGCARRFREVNMKLLRAAIVNDLNTQPEEELGRVIARGSQYPVPWSYRISEGSLPMTLFSVGWIQEDNDMRITTPAALEGETCAQYLARMGVVKGDIFTIMTCAILDASKWDTQHSEVGDMFARQWTPAEFGFVRLEVKDEAFEITLLASVCALSDIFEIDSTDMPHLYDAGTQDIILAGMEDAVDGNFCAAVDGCCLSCGIIRSRRDSDLRSTSDMHMAAQLTAGYGITSSHIAEAWAPASALTTISELILEGGPINGQPSVSPAPPVPPVTAAVVAYPVTYQSESGYILGVRRANGTLVALTNEDNEYAFVDEQVFDEGRMEVEIEIGNNGQVDTTSITFSQGYAPQYISQYEGNIPSEHEMLAVTMSPATIEEGDGAQFFLNGILIGSDNDANPGEVETIDYTVQIVTPPAPARTLIASVWANEACTVRPVVGSEYSSLFVKLERSIGFGEAIHIGNSTFDDLQIITPDEEYPSDSYEIRVFVDFKTVLLEQLPAGIYQCDVPEPIELEEPLALDFYLEDAQ